MIDAEKREDTFQTSAQTMEALSQTFHLKTSLTCSLEGVIHQVSGTILFLLVVLARYNDFIIITII